jgi:hypothetical protein
MTALLCFFLILSVSPFKSKSRLEAENAALRYQLIVLRRRVCPLLQGCENAPIIGQGRAILAPGSADRMHHIACAAGRTASPLLQNLVFGTHRFGLGLRTITQLFAIMKRAARASKQDRQNDFQNHSLPRCRDPDFPIHTLDLFPTNNADQRRSEGIQEAGQPSSFDISVPNCVCCSLRRKQVGLDVVVVALNERNDGSLKDRKGFRPRGRLAFAPYGCEPRLLVAWTSRWAIVVSYLEEPGSSNEIAPGVEIEEAAIAAIAKAFLVVPSWV